jgi:hypothetical protein
VNNPSQLSCHASGTAIDWNAPDHPNGSSGTFSNAQVTTIYTILAEVEGAVAWLESYDEMHFEICVSASTLAGVAARLGGSTPPSTGDDVTDDDIKKIAKQVWQHIIGSGGAGATLEEVRTTNRDMNAKLSKLCDPRNGNVDGTG